MSEPIARTYVWHGARCWMVSTVNRESSAAAAHGARYAETMVWEWDETTRGLGRLAGMDEAGEGSIYAHQRMVQRLHDTGGCDEPGGASDE
jgi:hypothetical protein